jgi:hypothetical protein
MRTSALLIPCGLRKDEQMLEMRVVCEKCSDTLADAGDALICSFECTFCVDCGQLMDHRCPNCGGELVKRPRRVAI